uniref:Uncharacterized protein n=1 Tax=Panagrolaimus sp. PS1159 TaxID=55785 RepID=A0AC35FFL0_9BILA
METTTQISVNTWLASFSQKSASERVSSLDVSNDNGIIFPTILILNQLSSFILLQMDLPWMFQMMSERTMAALYNL